MLTYSTGKDFQAFVHIYMLWNSNQAMSYLIKVIGQRPVGQSIYMETMYLLEFVRHQACLSNLISLLQSCVFPE